MSQRVFLVEDHPLMQESLQMYLELAGLEPCAVVASAEEALAQIFDTAADLAVIDVSLPGMDGIELVRRIRARRPTLPCLVLSGHAEDRFAGLAREAGAVDYVVKNDVDAIIAAIERALNRPPEPPRNEA